MKKSTIIVGWLILSSANADKLSLSFKGALMSIIPLILFFADSLDIQASTSSIQTTIDLTASIIVVLGGAISSMVTAYGLIRKIFRTLNGTNEVIKRTI